MAVAGGGGVLAGGSGCACFDGGFEADTHSGFEDAGVMAGCEGVGGAGVCIVVLGSRYGDIMDAQYMGLLSD